VRRLCKSFGDKGLKDGKPQYEAKCSAHLDKVARKQLLCQVGLSCNEVQILLATMAAKVQHYNCRQVKWKPSSLPPFPEIFIPMKKKTTYITGAYFPNI
jgi:hypothetical protein